jgi:hypothetical protein
MIAVIESLIYLARSGSGDCPSGPYGVPDRRYRPKPLLYSGHKAQSPFVGPDPPSTTSPGDALGRCSKFWIKPRPILGFFNQTCADRILPHVLTLNVEVLGIANPMIEEIALKLDAMGTIKVPFPISNQGTQTVSETRGYDQMQVIGHQQQERYIPFFETIVMPGCIQNSRPNRIKTEVIGAAREGTNSNREYSAPGDPPGDVAVAKVFSMKHEPILH